jgi:hypothetical protein
MLCNFSFVTLILGKTPQIPCVSVFCNPRTVEPTHTFQEQLIVVKNRFLAAQKNNSISQAAQNYFILLRAARNNIGCFSHVTKLANLRVENTSFQSNTKLLIFCRGSHFVVLSVSQESRIHSNNQHS